MSDDKLPETVITSADQANPEIAASPSEPKQNYIKLAVDYGPLVAWAATFFACRFFKLTSSSDDALVWASGVLGAASALALVAGLLLEKRLAWIPLVSCLVTIPFAVLTVYFHNPMFVKIKMTIVDALIGGILLGALALKRQPLKALLGETLKLKETAWPRLTLYYALFYLAMAALNEIIWRTQSNGFWVTWKLASIVGGPILLTLCLMPFLMRNMIETEQKS